MGAHRKNFILLLSAMAFSSFTAGCAEPRRLVADPVFAEGRTPSIPYENEPVLPPEYDAEKGPIYIGKRPSFVPSPAPTAVPSSDGTGEPSASPTPTPTPAPAQDTNPAPTLEATPTPAPSTEPAPDQKTPDNAEPKKPAPEKPKILPFPTKKLKPPTHQPKNPPSGNLEFPADVLKAPVPPQAQVPAQEKVEEAPKEEPKEDLGYFDFNTGKPYRGYTKGVQRRFSAKANKGISFDQLSREQQDKTLRIFNEVRKAIDVRSPQFDRSLLFVDEVEGRTLSERFEKEGIISPKGAWTVAVQGTAARYGFPDRPCAELVSEILRQAYERAGYSVHEDFKYEKGTPLILYQTASVVGLSATLYNVGWVAWDASLYQPPVGAIGMHGNGMTPGHTYMIAGDKGLLIVDNGSPLGKDLRKTTRKDVNSQYETGVFFLPPGINPHPW